MTVQNLMKEFGVILKALNWIHKKAKEADSEENLDETSASILREILSKLDLDDNDLQRLQDELRHALDGNSGKHTKASRHTERALKKVREHAKKTTSKRYKKKAVPKAKKKSAPKAKKKSAPKAKKKSAPKAKKKQNRSKRIRKK